MYKNQLQELAQRSCFNLPSYSCIREGPDHGPRFKATVTFNGEAFESPSFYSTLRQAEHSAAQLALATLAIRGPSRALAARVLDETGVYKNLLQETAHRAGLNLPVYTTVRSSLGHVPVFVCTVELAGMSFTGEPTRTKKQAQKNAALSAWSSLKTLAHCGSPSSPSTDSRGDEEQVQVTIARVLGNLRQNDNHHHLRDVPNSTISLCSSTTHFQNWVYPNYPPEKAMYQLWHQEQFLHHHQHRFFQIPISPSRPSTPQLFPFVRSVIRPDHFLYFPVVEQASVSAGPPRLAIAASSHLESRSTVTIREIQEENPPEEAPSPRASESSPANDDYQRTAANVKLAESQTRAQTWDREWVYHHPRPNPRPPPRAFGPTPVVVRTMGPTSGPRMRTGISPSPARPIFMAPAVRIRSVVPVCSAPPPRRAEMAGASWVDGPLLPKTTEKKNNEDEAISELDKLHIYIEKERGPELQ